MGGFAKRKRSPRALEIFLYTDQTQVPATLGNLVGTLVRSKCSEVKKWIYCHLGLQKRKNFFIAAEQDVVRVFAAIIIKCGAGRCKSLCGLFLNKVCKCLQNLLGCLAFLTLRATKQKKLFYCGGEKSLLESLKPRFLHCTKNFCTLGGFAKRKRSLLCLKFFLIPTKRKFQLRLGTWSVLP